MTTKNHPFLRAGTALAVATFLTACGGGGDATAPGVTDTTPPTVAITDNIDATATTNVTFNFTFSEAVNGFTSDDVSVTNGTKGAFSMSSDSRSATLVVTPTANASGSIEVLVAAGSFMDTAGNASTVAATANQAFDTRTSVTPVSGNTGTCTAAPCINFAEANIAFTPFEGLGAAVTAADPVDATNRVAKLTKVASGQPWAGVTVDLGSSDHTVTRIDPALGISLRVYSPAIGEKIMVKIEGTGAAQEAQATSTKANEWETLSFSYPNAEVAATYNKVSIFPGFTTQVNKDYYVDELKYTAKSSGGGSQNVTPITFSSGFASNVLTASGGLVATAGGSNLDNWSCSGDPAWCGSFAGGSGADSYAGFYYQTPTPASGLYSQIEVFGPNNGTGFNSSGDTTGVTISNQTKLNFKFNQNPEWFNSSNNKFGVVITLGKRYTIDGGCRLQLHGVKTPTSADATAYSMTLANDFRVAADCGTGINNPTAALAASPVISSVKFIGATGGAAIIGLNNVSSGANLSTVNGSVYPTTVVLKGAITFD